LHFICSVVAKIYNDVTIVLKIIYYFFKRNLGRT